MWYLSLFILTSVLDDPLKYVCIVAAKVKQVTVVEHIMATWINPVL